jgi:hypothetical protein
MILLSLNIRGIGGSLKAVAFRRVLDRVRPDIIFLQETLVDDFKARNFVQAFRPSWVSSAVSSFGTSGGLLVSWDPDYFLSFAFFILWGYFLIWSNYIYSVFYLFTQCLWSVYE